jgi:peptidoglycan/LPS O-acetylase OafA/YrhL
VAEDLVFLAVLVLVSGMTFRYIEDPFRRWARRISVR